MTEQRVPPHQEHMIRATGPETGTWTEPGEQYRRAAQRQGQPELGIEINNPKNIHPTTRPVTVNVEAVDPEVSHSDARKDGNTIPYDTLPEAA